MAKESERKVKVESTYRRKLKRHEEERRERRRRRGRRRRRRRRGERERERERAERKTIKYADLLETVRSKGYKGCLLTVEVGSRGLPNTLSFTKLKEHLGLTNKITKELMINTAKGAINESFLIWKARNNRTQ